MGGGKGNIKPSDGVQFGKGNKAAEKWTEAVALKLGQELIDWLKEVDEEGNDKANMFFNEFLIIEKDLDDSTIDYLCKKFTSFSELITKAKKIQEIKLVKYGVADRLNATMTKFVLTNHHGYKDKTDLTSDNKAIQGAQIIDPFAQMRLNNGINTETKESD